MGFGDAVRNGFANYASFTGRASRPEYWWWVLFTSLASIAAQLIDTLLRPAGLGYQSSYGTYVGILTTVVGLGLLLPSLALAVRRLHDTNRSGWWWWVGVVPVVGWIVLIIFLATPGTPGSNRFGPPSRPGVAVRA